MAWSRRLALEPSMRSMGGFLSFFSRPRPLSSSLFLSLSPLLFALKTQPPAQRHQPRRPDLGARLHLQHPRVLRQVPAKGRVQGIQLVQRRRLRRRRPPRQLRPEDLERLVRIGEKNRFSCLQLLSFFKRKGEGKRAARQREQRNEERKKTHPSLSDPPQKKTKKQRRRKKKTVFTGTGPWPGAAPARSRCGSPASRTGSSPRRLRRALEARSRLRLSRSSATAPGASARTGRGGS